MYFLLIFLLISCSNFSKLKSKYKPSFHQIKLDENTLFLLTNSFIEKIESYFSKGVDESNFMNKVANFKKNCCNCEFNNAIFSNWLILKHISKEKAINTEIIDFVKNNFENLDFCKTGYNLLHLAVYLRDPQLFIKYFNEKDLYSTGSEDSPRANPLQILFLLNLSNENTILHFLKKIDSCLNKNIIEKAGLMILSCRFVMPKVTDYFISKGAETTKEYRVRNPEIEGDLEIKRKIKEWKIKFTPLGVTSISIWINNITVYDPLKIIFTNDIYIDYKKGKIEFVKGIKRYSKWMPNIYLRIMYDLCDIFDAIELDKGICFQREYDTNIKKEFSLLYEKLIHNINQQEFDQATKIMKQEESVEYTKFFCFISGIEYTKSEKLDKKTMHQISKRSSELFMDKGAEDNLSLIIYLDPLYLHEEYKEDFDKEFKKTEADNFCEYFTKISINNWGNKGLLSNLFEMEKKDILNFIEEKYFGVAKLLIRLSEEFNIEKNKIYSRKLKVKNKKNKPILIKETTLDKIDNLKGKKGINQEELEEIISLARDKGWMSAEEVVEIKSFESKMIKKEKERKKGQAFKELQEYNEDQQKQKLEGDEKRNSKAEKRREQKETKSEEDRASLVDFVEAKANYFEMDKEEAFEIFQQLVEEENKEELVVLLNKAEDKIDKNFEVVKAQDEKTRQLLIIRGFKITKKLVLSILDKNQKKAITTLFREITKEIREEIFSFSEEEKKTAITKEMKELMRKYGDVFEVEIEENFIEEKNEEKNEERKKREYEIYKISDIDRGSDLYLFDKELNFRTPLALQNMREGRGDAKKISPKEELFEYRMLGHGEEGNLRIYYKLQKNKKIILEVTYKGKDSLSVRKIESLERKANQIDLRGIEIILF